MILRTSLRKRLYIAVFMALPLISCGEKATNSVSSDAATNPTVQYRSLADMGGGSGDQVPLAVPVDSLDLKNTPVEAKTVEKRSAKEVEACVDEKVAGFKGSDGERSVPSMDELKLIIQGCGS